MSEETFEDYLLRLHHVAETFEGLAKDLYEAKRKIRRLEQAASVCKCGPWREEIVKKADEIFLERRGCLTCDEWDGPVRLREAAE